MEAVGECLEKALQDLGQYSPDDLRRMRCEKFLHIGGLETA
jgi:hypothetical protein